MKVNGFQCITFPASVRMEDENVLLGSFVRDGNVNLAISNGAG